MAMAYPKHAGSAFVRDRAPWQVHQNYLKDKLTIQYGRIDDGVMQFQ